MSRRKTVKTSARGVIEDAPLEYASLMGKAKGDQLMGGPVAEDSGRDNRAAIPRSRPDSARLSRPAARHHRCCDGRHGRHEPP